MSNGNTYIKIILRLFKLNQPFLNSKLILATGIQEKETFLYDPKVDSWQVATSGPGAGACGDWTVFYALGTTWGISELLMGGGQFGEFLASQFGDSAKSDNVANFSEGCQSGNSQSRQSGEFLRWKNNQRS